MQNNNILEIIITCYKFRAGSFHKNFLKIWASDLVGAILGVMNTKMIKLSSKFWKVNFVTKLHV